MDLTRACINIQKTCPKEKKRNLFVLPKTAIDIDNNFFTISMYDNDQLNKFYVGHDEPISCKDPFTSQNSSNLKMIGQMSCFKFIPSRDKTFYYLTMHGTHNWVYVKYTSATSKEYELKQECNGGIAYPEDARYKWSIEKTPDNLYLISNHSINYYIDPLSPNCLSDSFAFVELNPCTW